MVRDASAETNKILEANPSPSWSARQKLADLLARRPHSEFELRAKLAKFFADADVEDAIQYALTHKWLLKPSELAQLLAAELARKGKSHSLICEALQAKGLPLVAKDRDNEIEKARKIAQTKLRPSLDANAPDPALKIYRLLASRGFDEESIESVIQSWPPIARAKEEDAT